MIKKVIIPKQIGIQLSAAVIHEMRSQSASRPRADWKSKSIPFCIRAPAHNIIRTKRRGRGLHLCKTLTTLTINRCIWLTCWFKEYTYYDIRDVILSFERIRVGWHYILTMFLMGFIQKILCYLSSATYWYDSSRMTNHHCSVLYWQVMAHCLYFCSGYQFLKDLMYQWLILLAGSATNCFSKLKASLVYYQIRSTLEQ